MDEFSLTNGAAVRAIGALESPRGTRKDAVRPDTILVDDFDPDQDCRNPDTLKKKKWEWFEGALFPTGLSVMTCLWYSAVISSPPTAV